MPYHRGERIQRTVDISKQLSERPEVAQYFSSTKQNKILSTRNLPYWDLDFGLLFSKTMGEQSSVAKTTSLWHFVMAAQPDKKREQLGKGYMGFLHIVFKN